MANADGSKGLLPESKWGHMVTLLVAAIALAVAGFLTNDLDLSTFPGWLASIVAVLASVAAGVLTSWAKKNR